MKTVPVFLLGPGGVGSELLLQIVQQRAWLGERNQLRLEVVAVADSRNWITSLGGIGDAELQLLVESKKAGQAIPRSTPQPGFAKMLHQLKEEGLSGAIFVDTTAAAGTEEALDAALGFGFGVATANKKALAGPWSTASSYYANPRVRHESTVGGGMPAIATMRYLTDIGDVVLALGGQLSGSLGFLCKRMEDGVSFSAALAEASGKGYTEPDPREDLAGSDAMRKALILARMAGWPLEASDLSVESLFPESLLELSIDDFMTAAKTLDAGYASRCREAAQDGEVLRYLAAVTPQGGTVGLSRVAASNPIAKLKYVQYRTHLYDDEPLLICGKGAGVEMTAGGVLGDVIALAREVL